MRTSRLLTAALATGTTAACLTACSGTATPADPAATGKIAIHAADTSCTAAASTAPAGTAVFAISNEGSKVTEFYVYAEGDRVLGEVENILPGVTRDLHVELPAGAYQLTCKPGMVGAGVRTALHVTGSSAPLTADAALAEAAASYQRYVTTESAGLQQKTKEFTDAVKAGDLAKAKALYPVARTYWERIEPIASSFGDLDPKVDGRADTIEPGAEFTGFHRLEKDLWQTGDISDSGPIADRLTTDIAEIAARSTAVRLSPLALANGAKSLLDEIATGKITGEEDRYSHTDLWDFAANIEGSKAAIAALRPVLQQRSPDLIAQVDAGFATVDAALAKHRAGDGYRLHTELSKADLKELSDVINALAEPVSRVAAAITRQ
ncbi:iron uptake system protein EfeO [Actinoplanes sp. L3-i22]|uniref:iron uptake system protein EfeO n=1 Tax=Actinoplanes sp. L3-i22 TaxID=2836373 RepID=UPI001C77BF89|nr:iron uptake system protein EfeO [Actinoplanes sp. L3-i22]BCY11581.1 lipoprotein [Actinoplanes sp. L3-i22]